MFLMLQFYLKTLLIEKLPSDGSKTLTSTKNINIDEEFAFHSLCSSYKPTLEMILDTMHERGGPKAFKVKNSIGITPSRYLKGNPYTNVTEKDIIEKYVLNMMGEL